MNPAILADRLQVLANITTALTRAVQELTQHVRSASPSASSPAYKATEHAHRVLHDLAAAVNDLLDEVPEAATTTSHTPLGEQTTVKHEAFGIIQVNRVSGHARLFGSQLPEHMHFIQFRLSRASAQYKKLDPEMRPWPDSSLAGNIVEFSMSAAQFAEMITTMNYGLGTPVTLNYVRGRRMAPVPETHENRATKVLDDFREHMAQAPQECAQAYAQFCEALDASGLSKAKRETLHRYASVMAQRHDSVVQYTLERFDEAAEATTTAAKAEVDAALSLMVQRAGMEHLRALAPTSTPNEEEPR